MFKLFLVLLCLLSIKCCLALKVKYPIYYAEDICDKTLKIGSQPEDSSMIIKLSKTKSSHEMIKSCKVSIVSLNEESIHTNINHMIASYKSKDLKTNNSITFTNFNNNRRVVIQFNGLGDDIHLIVTSYIPIDDNQLCPKSYFLCEKNKCIRELFRCDTYLNCEYDENELACALELTPGNTILLAIILCVLCSLLGTTCLLSSYVYYRYYQKRNNLLDSKQILYGTVNASYPVSVQHSLKVYK